jgi:hypothetical protein
VRELVDDIRADMCRERYGIGWWAPHPGTKRRILISDHLVQCAASIETNLVEARLHDHHARYFRGEVSRQIAGVVQANGTLEQPSHDCPRDDLSQLMAQMHTAGVLRAVGSAMDCLGAVAVGVVGIPRDIKAASLSRVFAFADQLSPSTAGETVQADALVQLGHARDEAGPSGWLTWAVALRNMYVHRARRISKSLLRETVVLVGPDGRPLPRVEALEMLPREPGLSEMEVLATGDPLSVLTERSETTLSGVIGSARTFANDAAQILKQLWDLRREQPPLLAQPREQWRTIAAPNDNFRGYDDGSVAASPDTLITAPDMQDRLCCASLDGDNKEQWASFD